MANNMGGGGTPTTLGCTSGVAWVGGGVGGTWGVAHTPKPSKNVGIMGNIPVTAGGWDSKKMAKNVAKCTCGWPTSLPKGMRGTKWGGPCMHLAHPTLWYNKI